MRTLTIRYNKYFRDSRFFYDVTNDTVNFFNGYIIIEFDYKIFFGMLNRHRKMYLMNDAIESIELRDSLLSKKETITQ